MIAVLKLARYMLIYWHMSKILGIDLGTTNSCVAVIDGDIDAWLRAGGPTTRNKNYLEEE